MAPRSILEQSTGPEWWTHAASGPRGPLSLSNSAKRRIRRRKQSAKPSYSRNSLLQCMPKLYPRDCQLRPIIKYVVVEIPAVVIQHDQPCDAGRDCVILEQLYHDDPAYEPHATDYWNMDPGHFVQNAEFCPYAQSAGTPISIFEALQHSTVEDVLQEESAYSDFFATDMLHDLNYLQQQCTDDSLYDLDCDLCLTCLQLPQ